ncbi:hypothetical protein BGW39_004200 [Mortierella sp. 14UC]|nr:hypothetical protein BGW39_004200 [Mortierella sp. 14UC]
MPAFSPTPNARSSTQTQPYDGFAEVDYQEDLPEFFDDNDNNGGNMVAEDSLAGTSGEALSWSVTPQRGVEADAVEVKQEVPHSVQKDIIPSTFPSRMSKSRSQPEAEEESVEEELFERCMGSISPEVESESHDDTNTRKQQPSSSSTSSQKFVISRHNIFKTSHDSAKTRRMKTYGKQGRGRGRLSIPDHVKRQLNKDTLDLISHTPSVQQVFLCVEIPIVPEIGSKSHTPLKAKAKAPELGPGPGRKRAAEGSSKRKTKLTSLQPPPPPLPPKSARQSAGQKRKQSNIQRRSSRRAGAHRSGTYYEKTFSDDYDEEEEDEHKSEDKSGGDELEVIAVSPSVNPRPIRTHLLPPKKRIRPHVAFQKDSLPPSQDQQRHQPGPRILHDSDSDGEQAPRNVQRRRTSGVRLPSTSPATAQEQEQEYEQEQDLDQDMQRSPSPRPSASGQGDEKGRRQASDAEGRDDEEQGQGTAQRWEVTKLQNMWKEHGIRWPLRRGQGQEEYNTYFVFGSALPLPK